MHTSVNCVDKPDMVIHRTRETWIDLGKYEAFVMEKHTARETEEWLEKWTEHWKQIGVDRSVNRRSNFKNTTLLSLLQLMFPAESRL